MSKKLPLRYERSFYEAPLPPKMGQKKFRIELITSVSDRANHWPGANGDGHFYEYEYDEPEEIPEYTGDLGYDKSLSLKELNKLVEIHELDESKVFVTASFSEDHLSVEVVHVKEQTPEEIEEEYQERLSEWNQKKKAEKKDQLQRIKQEIEYLKSQEEKLKQ